VRRRLHRSEHDTVPVDVGAELENEMRAYLLTTTKSMRERHSFHWTTHAVYDDTQGGLLHLGIVYHLALGQTEKNAEHDAVVEPRFNSTRIRQHTYLAACVLPFSGSLTVSHRISCTFCITEQIESATSALQTISALNRNKIIYNVRKNELRQTLGRSSTQ